MPFSVFRRKCWEIFSSKNKLINKKHSIYLLDVYQLVFPVPSMKEEFCVIILTDFIWKTQVAYRVSRREKKLSHPMTLSTDMCDSLFPCRFYTKNVNLQILLGLLLPKRPPPYSFFVYDELCQKCTRDKFAEPSWLPISILDER